MWGDLTPVCRFQVWHWKVEIRVWIHLSKLVVDVNVGLFLQRNEAGKALVDVAAAAVTRSTHIIAKKASHSANRTCNRQ